MEDFLAIAGALSDESRVRIVLALRGGELCACQLTELLGLAPSTVSKHMTILKQARLVRSRKDGRWVYYSLAGENAPSMVQQAIRLAIGSVARSPEAREDRKRLKKILEIDKEELCKLLRKN